MYYISKKTIELDRVHRIGKETPGKTRPIVAKFHHYSDQELVRKASIEKNTDLRALHQGVGIQQTKATWKSDEINNTPGTKCSQNNQMGRIKTCSERTKRWLS
ncbi:hypothetical protein DPMN_098446 [Dreissena polymorpha]|uniref:Uncharacterized protein n=1 Tax=Dreissena polymorpha TaxID=45954 RepID=A0A9D4R6P8_DREPO|nr:hypothetical protein DPMN_098446 [Dreissena polymorpha]